MKNKHHKAISEFIWNRKGKPFSFADLKKKIHHYGNFGGSKYKKWLKQKYHLKEFKEKGRVMLQRIPKEESSKSDD